MVCTARCKLLVFPCHPGFVSTSDKLQLWKYLYGIYEGTDVPRWSIEIETDSENGDKECIVEVFHKKLVLYILPKREYHLTLVKPAAVYLPRKCTVFDLRKTVATVLFEHN